MVIIDSEKDKPVMIERKKEMDNLGKSKMGPVDYLSWRCLEDRDVQAGHRYSGDQERQQFEGH